MALRDGVCGRIVAYALGSALENHDEEGVGSDPRFGENNTFYLQAMATLPSVQNQVEIENKLLELCASGRSRLVSNTSRRSSRSAFTRPARNGCARRR